VPEAEADRVEIEWTEPTHQQYSTIRLRIARSRLPGQTLTNLVDGIALDVAQLILREMELVENELKRPAKRF
jgi:hypothetical protein